MPDPCGCSRRLGGVAAIRLHRQAVFLTVSSTQTSEVTALPLTGGCNCGRVRYEVTTPLVTASYCHCKRCQRRSGAAASPNAHPAPGSFHIVAGKDALRMWKPADSAGRKWFCSHCGSHIYGDNPSHPDSIGIRMGTFDNDPIIRPTQRQFVTYAAPWEPLPTDNLRSFPESRHTDHPGKLRAP